MNKRIPKLRNSVFPFHQSIRTQPSKALSIKNFPMIWRVVNSTLKKREKSKCHFNVSHDVNVRINKAYFIKKNVRVEWSSPFNTTAKEIFSMDPTLISTQSCSSLSVKWKLKINERLLNRESHAMILIKFHFSFLWIIAQKWRNILAENSKARECSGLLKRWEGGERGSRK